MKPVNWLSRIIFLIIILITSSIKASTLFIAVDGVAVVADPAHTQDVALMSTLGNTYIASSQWQQDESMMLGLGLRTYQREGLNVNTSLRFLPMINMVGRGDVLQLRSPQFHNLAYTYDITSHLLLVENMITWTRHRVQPGLIVGLGRASNTASNYHETSLFNHASSGLVLFSDNTKAQFAVEWGAVLDFPFKGVIIECAYRYIDAGQGQLGLSSLQNTSEHLSTGSLHYHAVSLGVRFERMF